MLRIMFGAGNKAAFKSLMEIRGRTQSAIKESFFNIGPQLVKTSGDSMKETKSGNLYKVYWSVTGRRLKKGRTHQASAKNETPAIVSGRLMRSLGIIIKGHKSLTFGARGIDPDSGYDYGRRHELSPRSYLKRVINIENVNIQRDMYEALEKELTKGMRR